MKLLLIGLGQLTGAVLDSAARDGRFAQIVLASRNAELGKAKVQAARIGAALDGVYPKI
jgi:saccharopine dehydrogenase-like NADP-dependent oxidoreductase